MIRLVTTVCLVKILLYMDYRPSEYRASIFEWYKQDKQDISTQSKPWIAESADFIGQTDQVRFNQSNAQTQMYSEGRWSIW